MKTLDEVIDIFEKVVMHDYVWFDEKTALMTIETLTDTLYYLKEYQAILPLMPSLINTALKVLLEVVQGIRENPPLTWDELRQMEGKPVWIDSVPLVRRWVIIKKFHPIGGNNNLFDMEVEDGAHFLRKSMGRDAGAWWQAYRKERS
jgi:hypothetical protein